MADCTRNWHSLQVSWLRRQFAQGLDVPFSDVLSAELIERVLDEVGGFFRARIFIPVTTLWVLLSQVTSDDGSCRDAVFRLLAFLARRGEKPCAPRTGSCCKARKRLPEEVLSRLTQETAAKMSVQAPAKWRWKGREVKVAAGTTLSMPDTPADQKAYPQPRSQKPGLGFPLVRLVCLFSLTTGAVLDAALGPYRGKGKGELSLFRKLRSLRVTLRMDVLRGKSPQIVRTEVWAHLLAYNLIRAVIRRAWSIAAFAEFQGGAAKPACLRRVPVSVWSIASG